MEYEKLTTAPSFSRKLRNHSHSLSFSTDVVYDGVFASSATKKSPPAVDYGEIFRVSVPSSIPFLEVPELKEEKINVDVRSSKLDYSSVFGGFEVCDFTITPEELIIKSKKQSSAEEDKWNGKRAGNSPLDFPSNKAKNHLSSPEAASMKQFNVSYLQTDTHDGNGVPDTTQAAQDHVVSGYSNLVDNPCLPKMESITPISSVEKKPHNRGYVKDKDCSTNQVDSPSSNGSRQISSKNEIEFENPFGKNGMNRGDDLTTNACKSGGNTKHPDVILSSSLQHCLHGEKGASERLLDPKLEVSESSRSKTSTCSSPKFGEETDANLAADASSAALKKAIDEAQIRMNIAKQRMERKKAGFSTRVKTRSSDGFKVEHKGNIKLKRETETHWDDEIQKSGEIKESFLNEGDRNVGKVVNTSKSFSNEGERIASEVVHDFGQLFPKDGDLDASEVMNTSELFPKDGYRNDGEVVNIFQQSIPIEGEKIDDQAVNASGQLIPNEGQRTVGKVVNSPEQSIQDNAEGIAGNAVNSPEQSFPHERELNASEALNSSDQLFPNNRVRDSGEEAKSSEKSYSNKRDRYAGEVSSDEKLDDGEKNAGEAVKSSEQSFLNHNLGVVVNSFEHSFPNDGEQNLGKLVNSSTQSILNEREQNLVEVVANEGEQNFGEEVSSSKQAFAEQREQQVKRARRLWQVPEGLMKSAPHNLQEEAGEHEKLNVEEERERKVRKQWEIPGTIFKSDVNSNNHKTENLAAAKPATDTNRELEQVTENSFYSFGQLGNKIKSVVEAFTGSKSSLKSEAEGMEHVSIINSHDHSKLTLESLDQEGEEKKVYERKGILVGSSDAEINEMEVENILKSTDSQSTIQVENAESTCDFIDDEEKEQGWCQISENAPSEGINDSHDISNLIHDLDQEGEKSLSEPQEIPSSIDTEICKREVEAIPRHTLSMCKTLKDKNSGNMASILSEKASSSGNVSEGNEKEHKTPRHRRVWKTSEDIYEIIKAPKGNNRAWKLGDEEKEMMKRCLREQSATVDDVLDGEETENMSELSTDSGLQENWNVLKQMFRQMFQTDVTKREKDACYLVESEQNHIEGNQSTAETSNYALTGSDLHNDDRKQEEMEIVSMGQEACVYTREDKTSDVALKMYCFEEGDMVEKQNKLPVVSELIQEELEAVEVARNLEPEAFGLDQETFELDETETFDNDQSETKRTTSGENVEHIQFEEPREETRRASFELSQGDSDTEDFDLEKRVYDQCHENTGSMSSMGENVDETDSESNKSGWDVEDMEFIRKRDENLKSFVEENSAGYEQDIRVSQLPCDSEEVRETKENVSIGDGTDAVADQNREGNDEERADVSQSEVDPEEERLRKINEAKEREREKERIVVERAIREVRERAFAEAKERALAEKAAMEKAKAGAHLREKDKLSCAEKASTEAKLRAERAAVEKVLAEARQRALEKSLSRKATSHARSQGNKSFSGSEIKSSVASSSSSHGSGANDEPAQRYRARSERHQRAAERAAKALEEKKLRDLIVQKEQAERNRLAETLDADVKRWSSGKESNLRALLSTLQYILGAESGWKPIPLTDLVSSAAVRKAYRKATLYVHPDKLQQRGATTQQKYICEKVFDLLKEAWNKFSADER